MKKMILTILIIILVAFGWVLYSQKKSDPKADEVRAMWISYIELSKWLDDADETVFTSNFNAALDNMEELGINTIYVHAVAFGDSFYQSKLYPFSHHASGKIGKSLEYDPYQIMIEETHKRKMKFEAWINPMRSVSNDLIQEVDDAYIVKKWYLDSNKKDKYIVLVDGRWYLNPGYSEVRDLVCSVIYEIMNQYKVDGIHIDDYFYPEAIDISFDQAVFSEQDKTEDIAVFRRNSVNTMIQDMYETVKSMDPKVTFSISPAGNIDYNFKDIYADVETWVKEEGYVDYVIPQIYFGYDHGLMPYGPTIQKWNDLIQNDKIKLIYGLAAYKINTVDKWAQVGKYEWTVDEDILKKQVVDARTMPKYAGFSIFSYSSLFEPATEDKELVEKQLNHLKEILK